MKTRFLRDIEVSEVGMAVWRSRTATARSPMKAIA